MRLKALIVCWAIVLPAGAPAQYQQQAEYLRMLRSPLNPTAGDCQALSDAFTIANRQVNEAHGKCIGRPSDGRSGSTCSHASCQGLHNLMDFAQKRASYERSVCSARLSAVQAEQRRQEQQARAAQEALQRQQQAHATQQRTEAVRLRREQLARSASKTQGRNTIQVKDRAEEFYNHPITQATIENEKNATAAAAVSGVDDVRPGLKAPTTGTALGTATTVGGVLLQLGIGLLNTDVYKGTDVLVKERVGNRHPADKIIEEDDAQFRPAASGCSTLNDPAARRELGERDPKRLLDLTYSCMRK